MDVNYSRWMSKDPDAEPEVIEDEPRRFSLPRPAGSVVASGVLVALVALGGGTLVRSIAISDASSNRAQTAESPTAKASSGPGAASVDDSTSDDVTYDDSTSDEPIYDDPTSDSSADDDIASDRSAPAGPRLSDRRVLHQPDGVPPGGPWPDRPARGHREPAFPRPMLAPSP